MNTMSGSDASLDAAHIERARNFIAQNFSRILSAPAAHLALHPNAIGACLPRSAACPSANICGMYTLKRHVG